MVIWHHDAAGGVLEGPRAGGHTAWPLGAHWQARWHPAMLPVAAHHAGATDMAMKIGIKLNAPVMITSL